MNTRTIDTAMAKRMVEASAIHAFLAQAAGDLTALGVNRARLLLDPGVGFGKTVAQNFSLLARQQAFVALGYPVLAGWSRKSSLAAVTQNSLAAVASMDAGARMVPSVAAAVLAAERGASVVRVHDVRETVQALLDLIAALEDNDDVQNVYANFDIADDELEKLDV